MKFITSNFATVVKASSLSLKERIRKIYLWIDGMDDCAWDETNEELVDASRRMLGAVSRIQRETGERVITRYLANDAQVVSFALEVYDALNESYAATVVDSYTVAV